MILDSGIWKNEIEIQISLITSILSNCTKKNESDDDNDFYTYIFIELQKFTIYTSIIIRKLIEANKISDELLSKNFPITSFKKNTKTLTILNSYEIEKLYDLNHPKKSSVSIKNLSHFLIHSYHFIPYYSNNITKCSFDIVNPSGFYYSSDKQKHNEICLINISQYINILNEIISDFITYIQIENGRITKKSSKN